MTEAVLQKKLAHSDLKLYMYIFFFFFFFVVNFVIHWN